MSKPTHTSTMRMKASDIMRGKPSAIGSLHQTRKPNEYDEWSLEKLTAALKEKYGDGFPLDDETLADASAKDPMMVEAFFRKSNILF